MTTQDSTTPARTVAAPAGQLAHATSLTSSGRFAEAGALLLPLSKTHPSDPLVHRALGELFAARRDPRAALSHLQLACPSSAAPRVGKDGVGPGRSRGLPHALKK